MQVTGNGAETIWYHRRHKGIIYTRTGRRFFEDDTTETALLDRLDAVLIQTGFWKDFETDWVCLDTELMAFKNIFNDWYARDTSKKIRAVFKAKGQSGKPLSLPIYEYKASEEDKHKWIIDDEPAAVVRKIYKLCISGYGPTQIARKLTDVSISYGDPSLKQLFFNI